MDSLSKKAHDELVSKIGSQEVLASFRLLVDGMAAFEKFELQANVLGQKKSLAFKSGRVSYFAFTTNRQWLLWYFRRPGLNDGIFTFEELKVAFPELEFSKRSELEKTEAIVRIRTRKEAEAVLSFVRGKIAKR